MAGEGVYSPPMKQSQIGLFVLMVLVFFAVGCSSTETRKYDISVRNEMGHPVTIWLTKDGPPLEAGWRSPEQLAATTSGHNEKLSGVVVPSGKTAFTGEVKGEFGPHTSAWLRVYDGQWRQLSDLLAVSPKSSDRRDFPLDPGKNFLVVKEFQGKMTIQSEGEPVAIPGGK